MPVEKVARTGKPRCKFRPLAGVAAPEAARAVTKAIVPFGKTRWMMTELIAAGPEIPRLRDQLDPGQDWVLPQRVKEPASRIKPVRFASECDAEIETETIYVKGSHPVAQGIHHHL